MMDGEPAKVPITWVDTMRGREDPRGYVQLPRERHRRGQRIQIAAGIFQGKFGFYQGMTSRQREVILLEALNVRVELASGDLG
jgi:hypothetical protein